MATTTHITDNYLSTSNVLMSSAEIADRFVVDNQLYYSTDDKTTQLIDLSGNYDEGQFLGKTKLTQNNTRLINVGENWTSKESSRAWYSVAMSSDGKYQTAVAKVLLNFGQIYISSDYGNTWTPKESDREWQAVAMSSDGKYQTAGVENGQLYVSNDYGNTWTPKESSRRWFSVAMSSDGKYQTAVVYSGGQIYISQDYGNNWTPKESNRFWDSVAMSSDGKYQTAVATNNQIYISQDYGNNWTPKESNRDWKSVAMSSDGKYQTAVVYNGQIYISSDYGNTWTPKEFFRGWRSIAMSSDGKYQTAVDSNGQIYTSVANQILDGSLTIVNGGITLNGDLSSSGNIKCESSTIPVSVVDVTSDKVFSDSDTNKIFHFNTTQSLTATFPSNLAEGFNVAIMNIGTNILHLSAGDGLTYKALGDKLFDTYASAYVYKSGSSLFATGGL